MATGHAVGRHGGLGRGGGGHTRQGGRVTERLRDGSEAVWGALLVWEPPDRLVMTWHPGHGEALRGAYEQGWRPALSAFAALTT